MRAVLASGNGQGMKVLLTTGLTQRKVTVPGTIIAAAWWCEGMEFNGNGFCSEYIKFGRNGSYNDSDQQGGSISADGSTYTCSGRGNNGGPYSVLVFYFPG